ncbi:hypothetical protein [Haloferula sp.]|uniref:WYL domain-containing protein n=1 Tax=Haloferula sp. TaxID=2497595 RepID=UPI003C77C226
MKVTRRSFGRLLGGLCLTPQIAPALVIKRLPLAPTYPVQESSDPTSSRFLDAIRDHETLSLYYHGGSSPGILRRFRPTELYRHTPGGPIIASGHCMLRGSTRTLRLDRVRLA